MVVFSCIRQVLSPGARGTMMAVCKKPMHLSVIKPWQLYAVRYMSSGGKRTMVIVPSKYMWNHFKNDLHFFFLIGLIPLGLLILYCNIFIGNAQLADIPEGYEPKNWEYYKHPIERWFARYVYETPQKSYEKYMHVLYVEKEKAKWRMFEKRVKKVMQEKQDYKGWYYIPVDTQYMKTTKTPSVPYR
ncbi:hypothetical protein CHS0354_025557 [Potamilus streckersoni]|uniref:NADH dehydrogenase [ubiquinone] 1 beta subcomplex subunit 5, mitochondrial n=1 Tax=Potamilus streckersoni TaxID=2493646 RepID=A0AAE0S1U9_9BIVA|nr:hypothetical protein CHS0354_025557 [Potamilus streckersoni]